MAQPLDSHSQLVSLRTGQNSAHPPRYHPTNSSSDLSSVQFHRSPSSGVARMLRAPVQRHVMGPLVTKQYSNSFTASTSRTVANCQFTCCNKYQLYNCKYVYSEFVTVRTTILNWICIRNRSVWNCDSSSHNEAKRQHHLAGHNDRIYILCIVNCVLLLKHLPQCTCIY